MQKIKHVNHPSPLILPTSLRPKNVKSLERSHFFPQETSSGDRAMHKRAFRGTYRNLDLEKKAGNMLLFYLGWKFCVYFNENN